MPGLETEELGTGTPLLTETSDFGTDLERWGSKVKAPLGEHRGSQTCARSAIANWEEPGAGPGDRSARLREQATYLGEGSSTRP